MSRRRLAPEPLTGYESVECPAALPPPKGSCELFRLDFDPLPSRLEALGFEFYSDEPIAGQQCRDAGRARPHEWIEDQAAVGWRDEAA